MLIIAALLIILIGIAHSYLGERYLITRLLRRDNLPKLFGSDWFTKRLLRFAWHITTIAWFGFAVILLLIYENSVTDFNVILLVIAVVFLISGLVALFFSKAKHLSWIVFFVIASICFHVAYNISTIHS